MADLHRCSHVLLGLLLVAAALGGCGDDPTPLPEKDAAASLPTLAPVSRDAKAAYALERLEAGPGRLGGLVVPEVHRRNLELATADLVFHEVEARRLLEDPARIARITGDVKRYRDAWHNILRLMIAFRARPASLVVPWTQPILALPVDEANHTLRLEAVRLLGLVPQPTRETKDDPEPEDEAGALLLRFFAQSPADREISALALVSLAERPALREAAYDLALREGTAMLWEGGPARVAAGMPRGETDPGIAGALAWWHALTVGSGPRMDTQLPQLKSQPWTQARLGLDPGVPPWVVDGQGRPRVRYGSIDSHIAFGSGWFSTSLSTSPELPAHAAVLTGKLPAAQARCILATLPGGGFAGYRAAVDADLALEVLDEGLYFAAKHCRMEVDPASDAEVVGKIGFELAQPGAWDPTRVRRLQRLVGAFTSCGDPEVWRTLQAVLARVRPLDVGRPVIEQAYDVMFQAPRQQDTREHVQAMLAEGDADDVGVALHLIRRARDAEYLDALEAKLDSTDDPALRRVLQRTLTFIYSAGITIEPARFRRFVARYVRWMEQADDARFAALAAGLVDFGDAGARAFADGLSGPKRALYLRGWPQSRRLVPRIVAEAAVAPVDRHTAPGERAHVLALAWSSFPEDAAPALEALLRRLPRAARPPVAAALERVRHRAPRHGDA